MSYARALSLNNSQIAGCMCLSPASHCCHARSDEYTRRAASVCERSARSRNDRISSGVGFEAGLLRPRFGWLAILTKLISGLEECIPNLIKFFGGAARNIEVFAVFVQRHTEFFGERTRTRVPLINNSATVFKGEPTSHFISPPLRSPEAQRHLMIRRIRSMSALVNKYFQDFVRFFVQQYQRVGA